MIRSLIAGIIATAVGLGVSAQASAERYSDGRNYHYHGPHHGWNNGHHHGWNRGHHYGRDRNHDGRIDWRDRRGHHWRDRNHDGRYDWRDRRGYYWGPFFGPR